MCSSNLINLVLFIAVFGKNFVEIVGRNDENDLRITFDEKHGLKELQSQVSGHIKEDFMNSEFYLIRWLRKANLNVRVAKQLLLENISWREQNNISSLLNEDFSDFEEDYYVQLIGKDKQGRPVSEIGIGHWDLRAAVVQGKIRRLHRYLSSYSERNIKAILDAQRQGIPVTRFVVLFDFDGSNIVQQGCPVCVSFLTQWVIEFDHFYPNFIEDIIFINVPPVSIMFLNTGRRFISRDLDSRIVLFDANKAKWMEYLDERIDRDQRSPRFGGTSVRT